MSLQIPLTQDQIALIDDDDLLLVQSYFWHAKVYRGKFYAYTTLPVHMSPSRSILAMHTLISGYDRTDHINRDTLDNRKSNLRRCSNSENAHNQGPRVGKYKGVYYKKQTQRWIAQITTNGKYKYLGSFLTPAEAAKAYDAAARVLHGEFAYLNFSNRGTI